MPLYFFHVEGEQIDPDEEGTELADDAAARVEAIRLVGELIREAATSLSDDARWRVVVVSQDQSAVFGVDVKPLTGAELNARPPR